MTQVQSPKLVHTIRDSVNGVTITARIYINPWNHMFAFKGDLWVGNKLKTTVMGDGYTDLVNCMLELVEDEDDILEGYTPGNPSPVLTCRAVAPRA